MQSNDFTIVSYFEAGLCSDCRKPLIQDLPDNLRGQIFYIELNKGFCNFIISQLRKHIQVLKTAILPLLKTLYSEVFQNS